MAKTTHVVAAGKIVKNPWRDTGPDSGTRITTDTAIRSRGGKHRKTDTTVYMHDRDTTTDRIEEF